MPFQFSSRVPRLRVTARGGNSSVVVGTLKSVDSSGTKFDVLQSGEHLRKLYVNSESKVNFVGLPAKGEQKPRAGLGVKATCEKDGRVKTISFTPPVGEPLMLGEKRLKMTPKQSCSKRSTKTPATQSATSSSVSTFITRRSTVRTHFARPTRTVTAYSIRRNSSKPSTRCHGGNYREKHLSEWFIQADKNGDGMLDIKEFAWICTSGNHIDNIFKRADQDKSGSLAQRETAAYIRSVTHEKKRSRKK